MSRRDNFNLNELKTDLSNLTGEDILDTINYFDYGDYTSLGRVFKWNKFVLVVDCESYTLTNTEGLHIYRTFENGIIDRNRILKTVKKYC